MRALFSLREALLANFGKGKKPNGGYEWGYADKGMTYITLEYYPAKGYGICVFQGVDMLREEIHVRKRKAHESKNDF